MVFKIRPSQEILKIRDGTPLEAEGILTYRKRPSKLLVARILVFKIRPSQEILKIRDGTPLEAEGILTYRKKPSKLLGLAFSSKLDVPSNVVQKKRVTRILVFKIRPSQEILKIRDGTPLEEEGILTYRKMPSKWPSQEILRIRDGTPLEAEGILTYRKRPSQEILKIRDGTPLEAEGILTYRKKPSKLLGLAFSSKLDVPSNVVQKKRVTRILVFKIRPSQEILKIRDGTPLEEEGILTYRKMPSKWLVAQILVFKIRPSQEILKIRDGTPLEAEGILTYRKRPRNCSVWHFSSKLDVHSNVVQKKIVAQILVFKIRPSQEILKIRDGTPLEAEGILTYRKMPSKWLVARILVFKIRSSQEILKIRDGTPLEAEGILTYRKKPSKLLGLAFSSKLDVPSNVVQKKRVTRILVFKIRPSQEILKIRDGTPLEEEGILTYRKMPSKWPSQEILKIRDGTPLEAEGILTYRKRPSQEILKIRDGTPLEAEGILTYRKKPSKLLGLAFSSKLDVPSNVVQKKRVTRILVFKIRPSQEILKIRDGTPLEEEGILTYRKMPSKWPSQEILKIRDGTPLEAERILTYRKMPSKLLVARILVFKIRPSQEILKIRDGTPLEAEGILTYRKKPSKLLGLAFSSKLDVPSNIVQKKRVTRILVFKIRPSQEILKIRDGTPLEEEGILTYRKMPSKWLGLALF
ncbi:hypothetical protein OROMI_005336 [Orobanche minor]